MTNFLENIEFLTDAERSTLAQVGADRPVALESAIDANPETYESFLGKTKLQRLRSALDEMITPEERSFVKNLPFVDYGLGVPVDEEEPAGVETTSLHQERNWLFDEIRRLKAEGDESMERAEQLRRLENRLIELVKGRAA